MNRLMRHDEKIIKIRAQWAIWQSQTFVFRHNDVEETVSDERTSACPPTRTEPTTKHPIMDNHLYESLYNIISGDAPEIDKFPSLQCYKAKILQRNAERNTRILLDTTDNNSMKEEENYLYDVLKVLRRRKTRMLQQAQDSQGRNITKPNEFRNAIATHLRQKFGPIHVDGVFS